MLKHFAPFTLLLVTLPPPAIPADTTASDDLEVLEEVVVTGRMPGPPLWKVSREGNVLWILPLIDAYPKKMEWDSARVEALIAQSQEYIERPRAYRGISTLNPLTLIRLSGLGRRSSRLADGQTLASVLPPDLHRRYSLLKARYLPGNTRIEALTISAAGALLQQEVLDHENLETLAYNRMDSPELITGKLQGWLKHNKGIRRTNPTFGNIHSVSSRDLKRVRKILEEVSTSTAFSNWEVACFEKIVAYFESDLTLIKKRANAWAWGNADNLVGPFRLHGRGDACNKPPVIPDDSPAMAKLLQESPSLAATLRDDRSEAERVSREKWLVAAEAALARNTVTFSVLAVSDILDEDGLVLQLKAKGYTVEVSAE
jgi:hypothetical protein